MIRRSRPSGGPARRPPQAQRGDEEEDAAEDQWLIDPDVDMQESMAILEHLLAPTAPR